MTVVDVPPHECFYPAPVGRACGAEYSAPFRDLIETTELCWFESDALPASLRSWFTRDSAHGRLEERTDLYRIDGRVDVGASASWSLALAAQGPPSARGVSIAMAWRSLTSVPPPGEWLSVSAMSCGYPEWLERRIDCDDSMIAR